MVEVPPGRSWVLPTTDGSSSIWLSATSSFEPFGRWRETLTVTFHSPWTLPCSADSDQ